MGHRRLMALALALAAPAWADTASVAARLDGEKAECDFLLGLCRAASRAARFARDTPVAPHTEVLTTRRARETELRAADALEFGRALKDKHGGKKLKCFDDPECAFVKARLFP